MARGLDSARLRRALHPLEHPPADDGWNRADLDELVPAVPCVEAAVLVGIVARAGGPHVLLTRRNDGLRQHGGQVSFPGGRIDPGDAGAVDAALRETFEEVGLPPACIEPWGFLDPLVTITGFRVLPVVGAIDPSCVARPDSREVAEVFEVPLAFLFDPDNLHDQGLEIAGRRRRVWEYRHPTHRIWGATASMLLNFRHRLEQVP